MGHELIIDVLSYSASLLEVALLVYLVVRGHTRRVPELAFYLAGSISVNAVRLYALHEFGFSSRQYYDSYWVTDLLLVFTAFVVVIFLFRRACSQHPEMWRHLRLLLGTVFIGVAAISFFSLSNPREQIYSLFIIEFSQNLYFACLVLTTLLYLLVVKIEVADERLGLLVCGLGIEFAGPAAGLALFYLTRGAEIAHLVGVYLVPLCDMGMILTWFYAVSRVPEKTEKTQRRSVQPRHVFAEEGVYHS